MLYNSKWGSELQTGMLSRSDIKSVMPDWESLCTRLAEDIAYYAPVYAGALLSSVDIDRDVQFATVWNSAELVAMLPVCRTRIGKIELPNVWQAWATPYTFGCAPLLDRNRTDEAAIALAECLKSFHSGIWSLPVIHIAGNATTAFAKALERCGATSRTNGHFRRAILERDGASFDDYLTKNVSGKRRRDLARNRRRLEEIGNVAHWVATHGKNLADAVEAFLEIEAKGWKGERGTALACDPMSAQFAREAFAPVGRDGICRADVLSLDGKPIAVSLMILTGRTGFTVKCAFDEDYRTYSAGLILELEVIKDFLSGDWADVLDSATAGMHAIDSLWSGSIEMADLIFTFSPLFPGWQLAAITRAMDAGRQAKSRIKKLIGRK
jgi:Acetyltransferase (GNAT) domain